MNYNIRLFDEFDELISDISAPSILLYKNDHVRSFEKIYIRIVIPDNCIDKIIFNMPKYEIACALVENVIGYDFVNQSKIGYHLKDDICPIISYDVSTISYDFNQIFHTLIMSVPFHCIKTLPDYIQTFILMNVDSVL